MLYRSMTNLRNINNESKKLKQNSKAQILTRVMQARQMLLDWGFNATFIETEDIHVDRRAQETDFEQRLREWVKIK